MAIPGDLYISVDFGASPSVDNGTRPYTGTNPFWNAFGVWLNGGPNQTTTKVGTPTTVKVRVSNKGTQPVQAVKVDAYVMNPFVGLAKPNQAIQRLTGSVGSVAPGSGSTSGSDAHVVTCQIQDPNLGPLPWTPTAGELAATTGGHLCLIANVFADNDGHQLLDAEDFKVIDDQHQAQRNITLLAQGARAEQIMEFQLMPAPEEEEFTTLTAEPVDAKTALGAGERWLLRSSLDIADHEDGHGLVLLRDRERIPLFVSDRELRTRLFVADKELDRHVPAFGEPQSSRLLIETSGEEPAGAMHVFDLVQRTRKGEPLGALRVITVITE